MLHHSLEKSHASKMFQLLASRSQLSIHLLLFNIVSYNLPSTDLLNSRWVHRIEFGLPYFKRRVDDWGQVQTPSQYWDSHICVKGEMNLVRRITGMARIIRVTSMQTSTLEVNPPQWEELPSLSELLKNAEMHLPFVILKWEWRQFKKCINCYC